MPLKKDIRQDTIAFMAILAINIAVFREYWTVSKFFTGKDFLTSFSLLLNFQSDCLQGGSIPLWNPFLNFGYPFVEHYSNTLLFPTHLLMGLITGSTVGLIQQEMLLWMTIGGFGVYLTAREMGVSWAAAIAAGVSYMCSAQLTALPQWHLVVYNATCFPFLILGYHRAQKRERRLGITTALFLAFMIYGGHVTTAVFGIYAFAAYVMVDSIIKKRTTYGFMFLAVSVGAGLLLAAPKLAPMAYAMKSGPRMHSPASLYTKDPFNVVNFYHFMSFLLPVKYYFSLYVGQLVILALIFGMVYRRLRIDACLVLFILTAWFLSVDGEGNVSLLRIAANVLPVMKLVRNEWLIWFYPTLFLILYSSRSIDALFEGQGLKGSVLTATIFVAVLTVIYYSAFNTSVYRNAWLFHMAFSILWLSVCLISIRRPRLLAAVTVLLLAIEFSVVFGRVNVDDPVLRNGDRIRFSVQDQGLEARSYNDASTSGRFFAVATRDDLRPTIDEARKNPTLTSGLGGDPTYNLYPEQFGRCIDYMNFKQFAGWWYNGQERYDFIRLKDSPMLTALEGAPLFMLIDGATGARLPEGSSFDRLSCSEFSFSTRASSPAVLLLRQMYDDRWTAYIDGSRQRPSKADGFFMAVEVPPGDRKVRFVFRDQAFSIGLAISLATVVLLSAVAVRRKETQAKCG